jgi:hypothetical protein
LPLVEIKLVVTNCAADLVTNVTVVGLANTFCRLCFKRHAPPVEVAAPLCVESRRALRNAFAMMEEVGLVANCASTTLFAAVAISVLGNASW